MATTIAASASGTPANATVYVRNLEEGIKIDVLKEHLTEIFSEYGNIIDLVAKRNLKAKGQAFIVFDDPASAEKAINDVQGFELFDKPMMLDYAKTRSDKYILATSGEEELDSHKRRRLAEKERKQAIEATEAQKRLKRPSETAETSRPAKASRGAGLKSSNPAAAAVVPEEYLPPNKTLFVQNLPDSYDTANLTIIFERFEGFKEIRLVPGRKGIAFVEYAAEAGAISAKESIAGMTLEDGKLMKVTYQRQ
ncbi:MAG: hypothetical protein M1814_000693 [Vezdaea aestivalis]|nr:MAG: hypothetical protein M1814_000693 [Vezdaea aestivalis]